MATHITKRNAIIAAGVIIGGGLVAAFFGASNKEKSIDVKRAPDVPHVLQIKAGNAFNTLSSHTSLEACEDGRTEQIQRTAPVIQAGINNPSDMGNPVRLAANAKGVTVTDEATKQAAQLFKCVPVRTITN